ncbi:MAG: RpiB/LacA/LacB family sugar-phosphate isomerase [Candidatus Yanofskybacteria bacterium]|nr:RpiB/LacA/LacB family sugar-phosphate isomerase [Candidatus Yanofskybacteria bacterium]
MKIYLATDHRGFELKEKIKLWLADWNFDFEDMGNDEFDPNDDYPDFVSLVAKQVAKEDNSRAIVLGASGQGEAMVANRHRGVRAVVYYGGPKEIITLSREHNNANVLSLGVAFLHDEQLIKSMIRLWLDTPFPNAQRHKRRIDKIDNQL